MKINRRNQELDILVTEVLQKVYVSMPKDLSKREFAEVLLRISQDLVTVARKTIRNQDDAEEAE